MIAPAKNPTLLDRFRGFLGGGRAVGGDLRTSKYDAVENTKKRRSVAISTKSEDEDLKGDKRAKLITLTHDARRNMSLAAWAIRKHLDYVASFTFKATTGDSAADDLLEAFVKRCSTKSMFDAARRHPMRRWIRIAEAMRTLGGDIGIVKIADGRLQAIEGDRIGNFAGKTPVPGWVAGVKIGLGGVAESYAIGHRTSVGFEFERIVEAQNLILHGYFDRFDQVRGVSPLAPGLNAMRDVYEASELALAKMKVAQLFALAIYSDAKESVGNNEPWSGSDNEEGEEEDEGDDADAGERYKVSLGEGPIKLELDGQDRAEFLESKSPSLEHQQFTNTTIALSLKSLDIPFSFYDEAHTNFSGARQGTLLYEKSAEVKRDDNRDLLNEWLAWRVAIGVDSGEIVLPSGVPLDRMVGSWMSSGVPWLDPLKEINANIASRNAGFDSTPSIAKYTGKNAYDLADEEAEYQAYRAELGLPNSLVGPGAITVNEVNANE